MNKHLRRFRANQFNGILILLLFAVLSLVSLTMDDQPFCRCGSSELNQCWIQN
jgi:hypothetical protein